MRAELNKNPNASKPESFFGRGNNLPTHAERVHIDTVRRSRPFHPVAILLLWTLSSGAFACTAFDSFAVGGHADSNNGAARKSLATKRPPKARKRRHNHPCSVAVARPEVTDDESQIVKVQVTIDEHGKVLSALALSGRKDLRKTAMREALRMRFEPATLNGALVKQIRDLTFDYSVDK